MRWLERAAVAAAAVAWGLGAGVPILDRYRHFQVPNGLDQGYFLQRIWQAGAAEHPVRTLLNTEQGHGLIATRHFEPILALFVPWVTAWPDHRTLLLGQLVVLSLTLPAAWLLARQHLHRGQALLATWAVLGVPVLWQMEAHGFRTMALATPLVAGTLWAASSGRTGWTACLALLALSCREEVLWALIACLPWLWWWRGRTWRDTVCVLAGLCLAWAALLLALHGGPSTFWKLSELPAALIAGLSNTGGASHTSPAGAAAFLLQWLGPGAMSALLAPLAALPLMVWWLGIQVSSGLAGPGAVHLLGPALGALCLVLPLGLSRLPRHGATAVLLILVGWGLWGQVDTVHTVVRVLSHSRELSPAGTTWDLIEQVPAEGALLTEARYLPAVAARTRVYATEDWRDPQGLSGRFEHALLRIDHPWDGTLSDWGFRIVRVSPSSALWSSSVPPERQNTPITPH